MKSENFALKGPWKMDCKMKLEKFNRKCLQKMPWGKAFRKRHGKGALEIGYLKTALEDAVFKCHLNMRSNLYITFAYDM